MGYKATLSSGLVLRSTFLTLLALLTITACRSESHVIYAGTILLKPGLWIRIPIRNTARADISQVCMALPAGYRYDGAKDQCPVVRDFRSNREVLISGRFIRNDSAVIPAASFGSGGPYARADGGGTCIRLPSRARWGFAAVELVSSDTLTVHALHWDTYYLNAFPPF